MRVISGTAKGRTLKAVPGKGTRPTTDKVKEAIFSIIGPYFDGGAVLDLFAGTGGLGIEALSRGADRAVFVDVERSSIEVIRTNLMTTRLTEMAEVYRNDAVQAVKQLARRGIAFDYIFLDPPYRMKQMDELLSSMIEKNLLTDQAIIVIEHDADVQYPDHIASLQCKRRTSYGETAVSIYITTVSTEGE
jgi:16S rRNA (guanine966-N2)-methyltransferase